MVSNIKIIIFDFWQTLADSEIKPSDLFDKLMLSRKINLKKFIEILSCSDIFLKDIALKNSMKILMSDLNIYNDESIIKAAILIWKEMAQKAFLLKGAKELLLNLKNRGYTLCLLTNIDKFGYEHFPNKEIFSLFDYQILSYLAGIAKPNIKCWMAIKNYYKVEFERMIMIGDSYENDTLPAQKLGIHTILIDLNTNLNSDIMFHSWLGR